MPRKNRRLIYSGNGDAYYVSPSAIGSSELSVTTPEVFVTANPDDVARWRAKQWADEFGTSIEKQKQNNKRERNIAKEYFSSAPTIGNIFNGLRHLYNSIPYLGGERENGLEYNTGITPTPTIKNPKELVKTAKNIRATLQAAKSLGLENEVPISRDYLKLKKFLEGDAYKTRLRNYYRDKGSSIVTQNHAPDDRVGEQLYNIETARSSVVDDIIDYNGTNLDAYGVYFPEDHYIQVATDALKRDTPIHEMIHASRRAQPYLDNGKYWMRPKVYKTLKDGLANGDIMKNSPAAHKLGKEFNYYTNVVEQEPRVLNTLMDMDRKGYDINNLTDEAIKEYFDAPIETFSTDTQSLLSNYEFEDIPLALRNFKGLVLPLGIGLIAYNLNKKRLGGRIRFEMGGNKGNKLSTKMQKAKKALEFVQSYYNSAGFKERFRKLPRVLKEFQESNRTENPYKAHVLVRHPLALTTIRNTPSIKDNASYRVKQKDIQVGDIRFPLKNVANDYDDTVAHEIGHAIDNSISVELKDDATGKVSKPTLNNRYSDIYDVFRHNYKYRRILNALPVSSIDTFEADPNIGYNLAHDAMPEESYADSVKLRYELNKLGIYDSRKTNNPFTEKHIDLYKQAVNKYNRNRLFNNFSEEDIIWIMNNVAQLNNNLDDGRYMAAYGGKIKFGNDSKVKLLYAYN